MPAAAIGLIGTAVTAISGAKASKRAAAVAEQGTERAIEEQRRQYNIAREDLAPWRGAGSRALGMIEQNLYGTPPSGLQQMTAAPAPQQTGLPFSWRKIPQGTSLGALQAQPNYALDIAYPEDYQGPKLDELFRSGYAGV